MKCHVYLTEQAKHNLVERARDYGYIRPTLTTTRGLSEYLLALSQTILVDNRPGYARNSVEWFENFDPRIRVLLELDTEAVKRFLMLAGQLHIYNPRKSTHGLTQQNSVLGTVLEAIGNDWITNTQPIAKGRFA